MLVLVILVNFKVVAFVGQGLDFVDLERSLHVPLESLTTSRVLVCERFVAELKLWQELVGESLLEHLTSPVIADAVRIEQLLEVKDADLNNLFAARVEHH